MLEVFQNFSFSLSKQRQQYGRVQLDQLADQDTTQHFFYLPLNALNILLLFKLILKLYEERKQLFLKWFETWSDSQRRLAIEEMFILCKPKQLLNTRQALDKISPVYHVDFSRTLPRVICLYIFSFLDPRSLCRCAQVSWYWKQMAETDQLWMPKCLRFGWNLNYIPNSFENGIWKQFYIENIKALQYIPVNVSIN